MRARYYISFDNIAWSEFWPTNTPRINYIREADEIFMRTHVDKFVIGRTRNQTIFDDLYSRFFDPTYFGTDIYYKINVLGTDKFYFIGPITDGKLNTQNNVFEATPEPNDDYRDILKLYDFKWHKGYLTPFGGTDRYYAPDLNPNLFVNVDFTTFSDATGTVSYTNTSSGLQKARNELDEFVGIGDLVVIAVSNFAVVSDNPTVKIVDSTFATISNEESITGNGVYELILTGTDSPEYLELAQTDAVAGSSGTFDYKIYYYKDFYTGARHLQSALDYVLSDASMMNTGITCLSTYLFNDALPTGSAADTPNIDTYITANPNNDYVIEGTANWNYLMIGRLDDLLNSVSGFSIADYNYSLKDVMRVLKDKLRAYWFIDPDGYFRIEHLKYFRDFVVQADLTSATYAPDKPEVDVRVYSYEKEDQYNQLNYSENNQNSEDWTTYPSISFSSTLTSDNTKDIRIDVTTDFEYIRPIPSDVINTGFILLKCKDHPGIVAADNYIVEVEASTITTDVYYPNVKLGWAYLFTNYWEYFAEAEDGTVNNAAFTFTHVKEFLKQNGVKFRMAADLDWRKPFTLLEGTGWVEAAEYTPETGMHKIDVGYNPYSVTIYVVDSTDITIQITDDGGDSITL